MSINVNGIAEKQKRKLTFDYIRKLRANIYLLQETHIADKEDEQQWAREWGGPCVWSRGSHRSCGVGILLCPNSDMSIESSLHDNEGRVISVRIKYKEHVINILNIYAPTIPSERKHFMNNIWQYKTGDNNLILGGDFNCVEEPSLDKLGGNPTSGTAGIEELKDFTWNNDLLDVWRQQHPTDRLFTWSNKDFSLRSRLDRWYIATELCAKVSGYSSPSPSSPSSPRSCSTPPPPIPLDIPSSTDASSQTPSTTNHDSSSQVMTSMTSVGVQHSTKLQNTTENAATTTDRVLTVATCSQTPVHTFQATSTQTETTSCTTTSTGTQATFNFVPACPSNSENIINKNKKKKSKQISQVKQADATTSYDPPPATPCHCRLCFEILDDSTPAESHLLTCYELPKHAANLRSTFFQQHAKKTGIPAEALQNQSALFLTTHPIDDPEPTNTDSTKDYLIGQLFVSAMDEFEKVDHYHAALSLLLRNLSSATLKHLKFNPSSTTSR